MADAVDELLRRALAVLPKAYAPYSGYQVACCLRSQAGNFYLGVNLENSAYSVCVCAETAAIAQAITAGEGKIKELLVLAADGELCTPCGACRQRIAEFATEDCQIHICKNNQVVHTMTIQDLLPLAFYFGKENAGK